MFNEDSNFLGFPEPFFRTERVNFPHANIVRLGKDIRIDLAVAGFNKDEIEISEDNNVLCIRGKSKRKDVEDYIRKEISTKSFVRRFNISSTLKITEATMEDGILSIHLQSQEEERKLIEIK